MSKIMRSSATVARSGFRATCSMSGVMYPLAVLTIVKNWRAYP